MLKMAKRHYLPPGSGMEKVDTRITFANQAGKPINLPHKYLLKIHAALARVLDVSGAGLYIDHLLRESDDSNLVQ
jgi:hypothetical protein